MRKAARWLAAGTGMAVGAYAATAGLAYARYGRPARPRAGEEDPLLDRFMPDYDVVERHKTVVTAPTEILYAAALDMDIMDSPLARAIFRAREVILGAEPDKGSRPRGILAQTRSLGWRDLAEEPGREIVMGAVTQPWQANVTFRGLDPDAFVAFQEPDFVKIAWTLRADPLGANRSIFRTETRALATDAAARAKFRRYWAFVSPGIWLIRWSSLGPLRRDAETRNTKRTKDTNTKGTNNSDTKNTKREHEKHES